MFAASKPRRFTPFDRNLTAILRDPLAQPGEGLVLYVGRNVGVSVHRMSYLRVPEDFSYDFFSRLYTFLCIFCGLLGLKGISTTGTERGRVIPAPEARVLVFAWAYS